MKTALAFSGGKDSMACLHLMREELDCAIYVDTGYAYPETIEMVNYAAELVPMFIVKSDREGQNASEGLPADVVPINWTNIGQIVTDKKPVMIQSYLQCCFENLAVPLLDKAKQLGVTHLVYGQRKGDAHRGPATHGTVIEGITRLHPIEDWTESEVFSFLAEHMTVPDHYIIKHSSLDCYDCTAFHHDSHDRLAWTKQKYPERYHAYLTRATAIQTALQEAQHA